MSSSKVGTNAYDVRQGSQSQLNQQGAINHTINYHPVGTINYNSLVNHKAPYIANKRKSMKYSSVALTPNEKSAGPLIQGEEPRNIPAHMIRSLEKARDFRSADRSGDAKMKGPYDVQTYSTPMLPPI